MTSNAFSVTALTWIKPEIDDVLRLARNALQDYVEGDQEKAKLRECAGFLHQVHATLGMVQIQSASLLAQELELLAKALLDDGVPDRESAYSLLIQGIVQLPDYLDRLRGGHKDVPFVLLSLLNQLRDARGEKKMSESALFLPNLNKDLPTDLSAHVSSVHVSYGETTGVAARAEYMLTLFQGYLLRWLKNDEPQEALTGLVDVCDQLTSLVVQPDARRLFWIAGGCFEGLLHDNLSFNTPLKHALAKIEREIKKLATSGSEAFQSHPPTDLTRQLLYFVAYDGKPALRLGEIRELFELDQVLSTEQERQHAQNSLSGHNQALLLSVSAAVKDDLIKIKEALDIHVRVHNATSNLSPEVESMHRIGMTLNMVGLESSGRDIMDQKDKLSALIANPVPADQLAQVLLDVASAVLAVEANLDEQVQNMGQGSLSGVNNGQRSLLDALLKEASVNFSKARQCVVMFIETAWSHDQLVEVPRYLDEVSGALKILDVPQPALHFAALGQYVDQKLLQDKVIPTATEIDALADAMTSLEYFLEAIRDRQPKVEQILAGTERSLTQLGFWPPPQDYQKSSPSLPSLEEASAISQTVAELNKSAPIQAQNRPVLQSDQASLAEQSSVGGFSAPAIPDSDAFQTAPSMPVNLEPADGLAQVSGFSGSGVEIDDEIKEIFIEEIEEELDTLKKSLQAWRNEPARMDLAKPVRKVFHTLKGSGRLVGAMEIGEFGWKMETLLNRVLDGHRPPSAAVLALVGLAGTQIENFSKALQGENIRMDMVGLNDIVDRVAAGEDVAYVAPSVSPASKAPILQSPQAQPDQAQPDQAQPDQAQPDQALQSTAPQDDQDGVLAAARRAHKALLEVDQHAQERAQAQAEQELAFAQAEEAALAALASQEEDAQQEAVKALEEQMEAEQAETTRLLIIKQESEHLEELMLLQQQEAEALLVEQEAERQAAQQEALRQQEREAQELEDLRLAHLEEERAHLETLRALEEEALALDEKRAQEALDHAETLRVIEEEAQRLNELRQEAERDAFEQQQQAQLEFEAQVEAARAQEEQALQDENNQLMEAEQARERQNKKKKDLEDRQRHLEEQETAEIERLRRNRRITQRVQAEEAPAPIIEEVEPVNFEQDSPNLLNSSNLSDMAAIDFLVSDIDDVYIAERPSFEMPAFDLYTADRPVFVEQAPKRAAMDVEETFDLYAERQPVFVQPAAEPIVQDVAKLTLEPVEAAVEPAFDPVVEPVVKTVSELTLEAVEPEVEPVAEKVAELTLEAVEPEVEPVAEKVAELTLEAAETVPDMHASLQPSLVDPVFALPGTEPVVQGALDGAVEQGDLDGAVEQGPDMHAPVQPAFAETAVSASELANVLQPENFFQDRQQDQKDQPGSAAPQEVLALAQAKSRHLALRLAAFRSGLTDLQDLAVDWESDPKSAADSLTQLHRGFDKLMAHCQQLVSEQETLHQRLQSILSLPAVSSEPISSESATPPAWAQIKLPQPASPAEPAKMETAKITDTDIAPPKQLDPPTQTPSAAPSPPQFRKAPDRKLSLWERLKEKIGF